MGFEGSGNGEMQEGRVTARHKRSNSYPDKRRIEGHNFESSLEALPRLPSEMGYLKDHVRTKNKQSPKSEAHTTLKEEIIQLEKRLQNQFVVRRSLENALGYKSSSQDNPNDISTPRPATELIKEIAVLELEVVHLEQYLLTLYRKAFDQQTSLYSSNKEERLTPLTTPNRMFAEVSRPDITFSSKGENSAFQPTLQSLSNGIEEKNSDSSVLRCHSSLSNRSAFSIRTSPPAEALSKTVRACHSQPLSMMEYPQNGSSNIISLAEHLGTRISDHVPQTPNRISEDMIRCMSAIFCKLADPALTNHGVSSPSSSLSSGSAFSPRDQYEMWSPGFRKDSTFDVRLDNPFHVEGLKEFSGPYSTMVEVPSICRDARKLGDIEDMLQSFRSLVSQLEEVNPRKMKHEEKLAFWINIHNALVMHAFLAYGIPQNSVKRAFLLLKAGYNIGGHTISADTIQSFILGCRMSRPGQWLRLLLSARTKFKAGDDRQAYAIGRREPLLHFALCTGSHSDPAVRVYTPKRVTQELEAAKEEYIRATFGVRKDKKILLPKVLESYAKDSDLCPAGVMELIQKTLPESLRRTIKKCQTGKPGKGIEWIPHNFSFRYLISKELVK